MGDSNRVIAESVAQTLATVTEQNEQISRTLLLIQGQAHHNKGKRKEDGEKWIRGERTKETDFGRLTSKSSD